MPELPDVEVFRRRLARGGLHRRIRRVEVRDPSLLRGVHRDRLRTALRGHQFTTTRRHGKHLFAKADGLWLVEHFGMTGYLQPMRSGDPDPDHTRFVLHFVDGRAMLYVDQRRLGGIGLVDDPDDFVADERLGPDALADRGPAARPAGTAPGCSQVGADGPRAGRRDREHLLRRDPVQARPHPARPAAGLDRPELRRLHRRIRRVLTLAIDRRADPAHLPRTWLLGRREDGARCPRGDGRVRRLRPTGRGAYYCPTCQPACDAARPNEERRR